MILQRIKWDLIMDRSADAENYSSFCCINVLHNNAENKVVELNLISTVKNKLTGEQFWP